ncbi:surface protease GP63, partial [Trypanosoma theileri]
MFSTGVVRELPRKGQSGVQAYTVATQKKNENERWELIRIEAFTEDLEDKSRYCTTSGEQVMNFKGGTAICNDDNLLTDKKKETLIKEVIPAAIKLHRDRLLVKPQEG